jgi:hypothetical protein
MRHNADFLDKWFPRKNRKPELAINVWKIGGRTTRVTAESIERAIAAGRAKS